MFVLEFIPFGGLLAAMFVASHSYFHIVLPDSSELTFGLDFLDFREHHVWMLIVFEFELRNFTVFIFG